MLLSPSQRRRRPSPRYRWSYRLFITILLFCPLAFATTEHWSISIAQFLIFTTLTLYLITKQQSKLSSPHQPVPGLLPLILFCLYIICQLLPLPAAFIKIISPQTWELYAKTIWVLSPEAWMCLSVAPKQTVNELFQWIACVSLYWLTVQLLRHPHYLKKTLYILSGFIGALAFLAIMQKFTASHQFYWLRDAPLTASLMGPWANRNHYANFMLMAFPLLLTLFYYHQHQARPAQQSSIRQRLFFLLQTDKHYLIGLSLILTGSSIILSGSRSATTILILSIPLTLYLLRKHNNKKNNILYIGAISTLILIIILALGNWSAITKRFIVLADMENIFATRSIVWQASWEIFLNFPWVGSGIGTFSEIFPVFQPQLLNNNIRYDHAYNDYLEILSTGGILAAILLSSFLASLFHATMTIQKKQLHDLTAIMANGISISLLVFLCHNITEFNSAIYANRLYFFFYSGILIALIAPHKRSLPTQQNHSSYIYTKIFLVPFFLLLSTALYNYKTLRAEYLYKVYEQQENILKLKKLIARDPLEVSYRLKLGKLLQKRNKNNQAIETLTTAIKLSPLQCDTLQYTAYTLARADLKKADTLYQTSAEIAPQSPLCLKQYGDWLMWRKKREGALNTFQRLFKLLKRGDDNLLISLIKEYHFTTNEIAHLLSYNFFAYAHQAKIFWREKKYKDAIQYYESGLAFLTQSPELKSHHLLQGYYYYKKFKQNDKAEKILHIGTRYLPSEPIFSKLKKISNPQRGLK